MFNDLLKRKPEQEKSSDKLKRIGAAIICIAVLVAGVTLVLDMLF
tara:strand:- start:963 stop:1097 length:135 start_codon:yes stop_codon:yes gene_type:complete